MLMLRPGALPALLRERFDHDQATQRPLDPNTAVELLTLVRNKILGPFLEEEEGNSSAGAIRTPRSWSGGASRSRRPSPAGTRSARPSSRSTPTSCSRSDSPMPPRPRTLIVEPYDRQYHVIRQFLFEQGISR
jgi:hypothetical protein